MVEQFLNHIEKHNLCSKDDRILLTVSGGMDSVVMFHLFQKANYSFGVAHCNFQLRNKESDEDEEFVKALCIKHAIPFYTNRFDTRTYADTNKLSIQMAARELRYAWFEELAVKEKYSRIATAHHLNDSIETSLINWVHGTSTDGLLGIPVKNGVIIRPLLFAQHEELAAFAKTNNMVWREDSSNAKTDYKRNFVRHKIIPMLKEMNPSLESTLQRNMDKITGEVALLGEGFTAWKTNYVVHTPEKITIGKDGFKDPALGATALWKLVRHLGFNFDTCENAVAALNGQSGKKFIGPAHTLLIDRDALIIFPKIDFWQKVVINRDQSKAYLGSWSMMIEEAEIQLSSNSYEALLDADKITFPLQWRQWKAGDVFYPLGMEHRKKVSDLLIDEKLPVSDKAMVTVLVSGEEIIWLVGYRIDNRYKITHETQRAISFRVAPYFV